MVNNVFKNIWMLLNTFLSSDSNKKMDKDAVLMRGSYTIHRKPMFIHEWTLKFTMKDDMIKTLSISLTFPQLPLAYWGEGIRKIANAILGKLWMTNECTTRRLRVLYTRVLIEVDITVGLQDHIIIRG